MTSEFTLNEQDGVWYAAGPLNENARFGPLLGAKPPAKLNLEAVTTTNSLGIKIFVQFMQAMGAAVIEFHACSITMLELFNSFPAALGDPPQPSRVKSFHLPFTCAAGGHSFVVCFAAESLDHAGDPRPCRRCRRPASLDGTLEDYLMFLEHS